MTEAATIDTPRGAFALRPERPGDAPFLARLFHEANVARLRRGGVPEAVADELVAMQHRSQRHTYLTLFPDAAFSIVVWNGEEVGRIVLATRDATVHVVDIALRSDRQARGLATALLTALQRGWRRAGHAARATVATDNVASRRLWRRLGFTESAIDEVTLEVTWTP